MSIKLPGNGGLTRTGLALALGLVLLVGARLLIKIVTGSDDAAVVGAEQAVIALTLAFLAAVVDKYHGS